MSRTFILAVCAIALLVSVQQASAGGARQLNAEIQENFAEQMTTRTLLQNNVPANLLGGSTGSATISNTGNGSGVGGSGASGSGASNTGQSQATSGAALAPGSIAPASG
ncbi:g7554 [Coccomyxa viridis]|uniref:G7554 protein n=1 Tax=Coccomyxa viridis TaxID=1274662 RepID=A0ABP1G0P4_9CHLO